MAARQNEILEVSAGLMDGVRRHDAVNAMCPCIITEKDERDLFDENRKDCNERLFKAAVRGNAAMVRYLVKECYADLEERGGYFPYESVTPLWCAAAFNKFEVVKCLIDLGADINAASPDGSTPVLYACDKGNPVMVKCLIRHGGGCSKAEQIL